MSANTTTTPAGDEGGNAAAAANLTERQRRLVRLIEYRARHGLPTVQRDLARNLGIRRDSLNKLLARTRRALAAAGAELPVPPRARDHAADLESFEGGGER